MREITVGLALGSGGAKGLAHIGVLSALVDHDIPIGAIAGSSMGSLVGAISAMGTSPAMMRGLAVALRRKHWVDFTMPKMGLVQGDKVHQLVSFLTRNASIEDTKIPLAIVATELISRQKVVFRAGSIADAVRASIAIPGVFVPFFHNGGVYVDGGVLERVPTQAAWDLGADVVLGVDVGITPEGTVPKSMVDVIMQSLELMQDHARINEQKPASLTIQPAVSQIGTTQFTRAAEAIEAGYRAVRAALPTIEARIAEAKTEKREHVERPRYDRDSGTVEPPPEKV